MNSEPWYYINTKSSKTILVCLTSGYYDEVRIPSKVVLVFGMKRCTKLEYELFYRLGINLKADKKDRYKWLKVRLKKWLKKLQTDFYARFAKRNTPTQ